MNKSEFEALRELEESLWRTETRYNLEFQEKVFAHDFFEFGRSGRRYTRDQMIRSDSKSIAAKLPLEDFKIHQIDEKNVLITYISEVQYEKIERANRSSLWSMSPDGWQLRFHQGTPTT